jgi:FkbM family methyltransferase
MMPEASYNWIHRSPQRLSRLTHALRLGSALAGGLWAGLRGAPVQIADVGARGGLSRGWQVLWRAGFVRPIFVEPEPEEAARLREMYPNASIIQRALGEQREARTLFVTHQPGCSSLLRPDVSPRAPQNFREMCKVVREVKVEVEPAQAAFLSGGVVPEVLKLDVQGFELAILRGLGPMLAEIDVVEIEVAFVATYADQPLIQEVVDFMFDNGFGMTHIASFGVAGTGAAIQANALFGNRRKPGDRHAAIEDMALRAMGAGYAP